MASEKESMVEKSRSEVDSLYSSMNEVKTQLASANEKVTNLQSQLEDASCCLEAALQKRDILQEELDSKVRLKKSIRCFLHFDVNLL